MAKEESYVDSSSENYQSPPSAASGLWPARFSVRLLCAVERNVAATRRRERTPIPGAPPFLEPQPAEKSHQVELGGPSIAQFHRTETCPLTAPGDVGSRHQLINCVDLRSVDPNLGFALRADSHVLAAPQPVVARHKSPQDQQSIRGQAVSRLLEA